LEKAEYDLILMDVQMPEMDGMEAMRRLHEKLGPRCPFIIALTAEALEGDREKFLGLGFDAYLSKPLGPEELQATLRNVPRKTPGSAA
jgi:two-component system sensor histidine kinase BarA